MKQKLAYLQNVCFKNVWLLSVSWNKVVLPRNLVDVSGDPFWVVLRRNLLMCLATPGSASGSTSICPWLWPGEMLPAYWPVCKFDLILPVLFLAFNVLTTITACHLPLYQCVAITFQILIVSARFIVPSVVPCYLVHWLNILSIAWPMMRVQRGFVFNIAWNLWKKPRWCFVCTAVMCLHQKPFLLGTRDEILT